MNPFLPKVKPKVAIVDYRASEHVINSIKKYNIGIIKTIKCDDILEPVNGHPDMVLHPIDYNTVVVAPNVYEYYNEMLKSFRIKVIKGGKTLSRNYPEDIAYNVARIGKYAIHNLNYTDEILRYYLQKSDIDFIHVNQGYSKCSMACIDEFKAVASDTIIYNTIINLGYDCMYVNPQNIILHGFNYGFIGGSLGLINQNTILATGHFKKLQDGKKLTKFIANSNKVLDIVANEALIDLGTIIVL